MKKAKKLTLNKKTIRELTNAELDSVAGGATILPKCSPTTLCPTSPAVCG